jgi:hypothetical protein
VDQRPIEPAHLAMPACGLRHGGAGVGCQIATDLPT